MGWVVEASPLLPILLFEYFAELHCDLELLAVPLLRLSFCCSA